MGTELDVRRIVKAPPECFVSSVPVDLLSGENKVAEYMNFDPYILSFYGLSFSRYDGLRFTMDVDGVTNAVEKQNLGSARGLDWEEELRIPAVDRATLKIHAPSSTSGYQWRHRVAVLKRTTALKIILGLSLTDRDKELDGKYGISRSLAVQTHEPLNLAEGVEIVKDVNAVLTSSGTVLRLPVPRNMKAILLSISAYRPSASASAYIDVERDGVSSTLHIDPYCMPSLEYGCPVRIVSLDKLEVSLDVKTSGTYRVRLTYGLGRLTVPEKIRWNIDLTTAEKKIAEELDIYDRVEAGVI